MSPMSFYFQVEEFCNLGSGIHFLIDIPVGIRWPLPPIVLAPLSSLQGPNTRSWPMARGQTILAGVDFPGGYSQICVFLSIMNVPRPVNASADCHSVQISPHNQGVFSRGPPSPEVGALAEPGPGQQHGGGEYIISKCIQFFLNGRKVCIIIGGCHVLLMNYTTLTIPNSRRYRNT